jgi:biotin--protein ligase
MKKIKKSLQYVFFIIFSFYSFSLLADELKSTIYVYTGPGASKSSLKHTLHTLQQLIDPSFHTIKTINPEEIKNTRWNSEAILFIMPGGADTHYMKHLSSNGNNKIRQFVENGGNYLGICAGSYYAGEELEFAKNTEMEVSGPRELGFFPGIVRGPVLAKYDYNSCSGCRVANLIWEQESSFPKGTVFYSFYNGGGFFVDAEKKPNTQVLANYVTSLGALPAIIEVNVGKGKAILSGPHWEYDYRLLDTANPYLVGIIPKLKETNESRLKLAYHILKRLGIHTRS